MTETITEPSQLRPIGSSTALTIWAFFCLTARTGGQAACASARARNGSRARVCAPWCRVDGFTELSLLGTHCSSRNTIARASCVATATGLQTQPRRQFGAPPEGPDTFRVRYGPRGKRETAKNSEPSQRCPLNSSPALTVWEHKGTIAVGRKTQPRDPCRAPPERNFAREAKKSTQNTPFTRRACCRRYRAGGRGGWFFPICRAR